MSRLGIKVSGVLVVLLACFWPVAAKAQATRTWVSGVGDDVNPCSRTAPCKTFAGAISKTAAGGEIDVLDPGGFGGVTITKSITISGFPFQAGVLVAGTNAIIVNAGVNDKVILRGLNIDGVGTGLNGIRFIAGGSLFVDDCTIKNFGAGGAPNFGIDFEPSASAKLLVSRSRIVNNASHGIFVKPSGGTVNAQITDCVLRGNGLTGLRVEDNVIASARRTLASGNTNGFVSTATTNPSILNIDNCEANENTTNGISAGFGTASATVRVGNTIVTGNAFGFRVGSAGFLISWGDNHLAGNTTDGLPTSTIARQ